MHPVLLRLGNFELHTYGLLVAAGFVAGLAIAQRRAAKSGIEPKTIQDLSLWVVLSAMLGAKLFYILFFWDDFQAAWRDYGPGSLRAGFVFYGGFIATTLTVIGLARYRQIPIWKLADAFAPALAIGHALGRVGCFFEGCCHGKACALPWAIQFPAVPGPVHPTQLYEAAGNLLIAGWLLADRQERRPGQVWWRYVLLYAVLRFAVEFTRGDYGSRYFGWLTTGQLIAVPCAVVAVIMVRRAR